MSSTVRRRAPPPLLVVLPTLLWRAGGAPSFADVPSVEPGVALVAGTSARLGGSDMVRRGGDWTLMVGEGVVLARWWRAAAVNMLGGAGDASGVGACRRAGCRVRASLTCHESEAASVGEERRGASGVACGEGVRERWNLPRWSMTGEPSGRALQEVGVAAEISAAPPKTRAPFREAVKCECDVASTRPLRPSALCPCSK